MGLLGTSDPVKKEEKLIEKGESFPDLHMTVD